MTVLQGLITGALFIILGIIAFPDWKNKSQALGVIILVLVFGGFSIMITAEYLRHSPPTEAHSRAIQSISSPMSSCR
jgi:uncharacterized membrane-anchored protein